MSPQESVHRDVKGVILAWARASSLDEATAVLARARTTLRPDLAQELREEVAEISIESLAELLARGQASGSEPSIEFYGVLLRRRQADQLALWLVDQQSIAAALGMKVPSWRALLERTLVSLLSPVAAAHQVSRMRDEEAEYWRKQMRKILGEGLSGPKPPPDEHQPQGGIMSLLSARRSGAPPKRRSGS